MLTIDVANTVFVVCLAVGGILLLITVLLGDILGGALDGIGVDLDIGGVSLMPLLLAFVAMFGVGGLIGTEALGLSSGPASIVGGLAGLAGAAIVYGLFSVLRRAEAPEAYSVRDLIGHTGRVTVGIPAGRNGSVIVSHGGATDEMTATSEQAIAAGATVTIIEVVAGTLVVAPIPRPNGRDTNA